MSKTYICTTGTSIAARCATLRAMQRQATSWEDDTPALRREIEQSLSTLDLRARAEDRIGASAELNVLQRAGLTPDDEVILLATDTADGRCCAEAVRDVLVEAFGLPARQIRVERVIGLQVTDAETLRHEGLLNLVRLLLSILEDPQRRFGHACVLCPNGGFKGVVPFMTLMGMLFRARVLYVFEHSDCLIDLPPLPLALATDLMDRALPAIQWAREAGVFRADDFLRRVSGLQEDEHELFNAFLESSPDGADGSLASLSPLVEALTDRDSQAELAVMLSPAAQTELERLQGVPRQFIESMLYRLASPLWRALQLERKYNSDLDFFPRGHQTWRFAGFTRDGLFHLCWFEQHDRYERLIPLPQRQRNAFERENFVRWDASRPGLHEVLIDDRDADRRLSWLDLREQRNDALARAASLGQELAALQAEKDRLRRESRQEISQWRRENAQLVAELDRLRSQVPAHTLEADSDRGPDAAPPHEVRDPQEVSRALSSWKGEIVMAQVIEVRPKSVRCRIEGAGPSAPAIVVPIIQIPAEWRVAGTLLSLKVTGHDSVQLQGVVA